MGIEARAGTLSVALAVLLAPGACATGDGLDLAGFLERRATCDHLRGEIPDQPDPARLREIERACSGTDAQLSALKKRYRDDAAVSRQLDELEPRVEAK